MPTPEANEPAPGTVRLLRGNRPLSALSTARIVSYAGDSELVALMLHVANTTG